MLSPYQAVILFSGSTQSNIIPSMGWSALQDYFNSGGKLIISGQNIAQDLASTLPYYLTNFLKVSFTDDHSNDLTIVGTPGNPLTNGYYLVMAGSGGAWNQTSLDVVQALTGAESFLIYNTNNLQRMAGVRVQSGQGDLFFCSFGIEGINDSTTSANHRDEVLGLMMEQFGINEVERNIDNLISGDFRIVSLYPNPFNSNITLTYEMSQSFDLKIAVFDVLGRTVAEETIQNAPLGINRWKWVSSEHVVSGVYFIRIQSQGNSLVKKMLLLR
jgi:hypothetical protein